MRNDLLKLFNVSILSYSSNVLALRPTLMLSRVPLSVGVDCGVLFTFA